MRKNGVLNCVLTKLEFQWIFDAKIQGPDLVTKKSLAGDMLQFKRLGLSRKLFKTGCPNGPNKSYKSSRWASMVVFF